MTCFEFYFLDYVDDFKLHKFHKLSRGEFGSADLLWVPKRGMDVLEISFEMF